MIHRHYERFINWIFSFFVNHFDMRRRFKDKRLSLTYKAEFFIKAYDLLLGFNLNDFFRPLFSTKIQNFLY